MCMAHSDAALEVRGERLGDTVTPEHYQLTLRPELEASTFSGEEVIDIRVKSAVEEIVLHAAELNITEAYVTDSNGSQLDGCVTLDADRELAIIRFHGAVGKGKWQLHLSFDGVLNGKLHGFYRSTYKDAAGREHVLASTQFEPNDARRAFPCFDEPSFKATFGITLEVDEKYTAISNGPVVSSTSYRNGKKVVVFKDTMKMSTYIVAFVVGEFEATESVNVNGTEVRIYHIPGKGDLTSWGMKVAQFSLTWYEKYFGIAYPGDKLDMIGIPDFAFGAMENLGCVTFRETALLVNEKTGTIAELSRVAEVVAHEIAHMWFGDLVTMKWWNGLWLNEAFATFMATKVEDAFRKEWHRWDTFGLERAAAFRTDGLKSTRSIEAVVEKASQALGMIDVITYRKGCSVLRQLEQYIGEEVFRKGIATYLRKHAYDNAETTDLWDAIESVAKEPVRKIMDSWVFQPGYPLLTAELSPITGSVTLSQRPFKYLDDTSSEAWLVPVHLRYKSGDAVCERWMLLDSQEKTFYLGENLQWVVANAGGHGFYRTRYSPELAGKLNSNLQTSLSAIERFNLINDAWACAQAGLINTQEYMGVVQLFTQENDPNVWSILTSSLSRLHGMLQADGRATFEQTVRDLMRPTLNRLGWEARDEDTAQDRQLRGTVIATLGGTGNDTEVQSKAKELYAKYKTDRTAVASDVVPAVVALVAHTGDTAQYDEFYASFKGSTVPQEQVRFLYALASFRDKDLLTKTLAATINGEVRTQDAPALVVRLMGNPVISAAAWKFVTDNWDYMVANYPETGLISMVSGITALSADQAMEKEVQTFFATHSVKGGEKAVAQNLELLRINVLFTERETQSVRALFAPSQPKVA